MLNHTLKKVDLRGEQLKSINIPITTLQNIFQHKLVITTQSNPRLKLHKNRKQLKHKGNNINNIKLNNLNKHFHPTLFQQIQIGFISCTQLNQSRHAFKQVKSVLKSILTHQLI